MNLNFEIQHATFDRATVTVTASTRRPINRRALRALVLQEVADTLGLGTTNLPTFHDATGYSVHDDAQWRVESRDTEDGGRVLTVTVTVPTPEQKEAKLRREGGVVPLADGSYGFVMPQPRK